MILVGVDFMEGSLAALAHARALSTATGMQVRALHVREYGEGEEWIPAPGQLDWMGGAGIDPADMPVRRGVAWVELARYAKEVGAKVVVVGRNEGSRRRILSLGSTALRLATDSTHPVLLVSSGSCGRDRAGTMNKNGPSVSDGPEGIHYGPPPQGEAG